MTPWETVTLLFPLISPSLASPPYKHVRADDQSLRVVMYTNGASDYHDEKGIHVIHPNIQLSKYPKSQKLLRDVIIGPGRKARGTGRGKDYREVVLVRRGKGGRVQISISEYSFVLLLAFCSSLLRAVVRPVCSFLPNDVSTCRRAHSTFWWISE